MHESRRAASYTASALSLHARTNFEVIETTALGAAYLAGLASGVFNSTDELAKHWQAERVFTPTMPRERALELMAGWERAVRQAVAV